MATWVITGASRGIGLELCRQLQARGETVLATCRRANPALTALGCRVVDGVEVAAPDAAKRIADALGANEQLDVLVHNAGVLVPDHLGALDDAAIMRQFEVNTLAPLRITAQLLPRLGRGAKIAFISSRAGSIGDKPGGGLYGYRLSKTALNMAGANLARDLAPQGVLVTVLHPGFIRTEMTGGAGNDDPPTAATQLIARIDELDASRSGRFFHANGSELPW